MLTSITEAQTSILSMCTAHAPTKVANKLRSKIITIGRVEALLATPEGERQSQLAERLLLHEGIGTLTERHGGRLAHVGPRDDVLHFVLDQPRGENLDVAKLNLRQLTMVCTADSQRIAQAMSLPDRHVPVGLQGENIVVSHVALTDIPTGSTIVFLAPDGVMRQVRLYVTAHNNPCEIPGNAIRNYYGSDAHIQAKYKEAAYGIRGLTLIVEFSPVNGEYILPGDFAIFFAEGV